MLDQPEDEMIEVSVKDIVYVKEGLKKWFDLLIIKIIILI